MVNLITEHMDIWTAAQTQKTNVGRGRGKNSNGQSPYGIKKLRELILDLAVRGKLVPQDPKNEPARVLLENIAKEKARLIKEGKIKKQKPLTEIGEDEKPFELPVGWQWARIADIGHDWGQKKPDKDFTYIEVSGIDNVVGRVKSPNRLTAAGAPSRARKIVKVGTVIYSTVRPYLQNICVIDQKYSPEPIASTAFAILHPFQQMPGKFLTTYLRSPVFVSYVESVQTGIAYPAINDKQFFGGLVPIPPRAEQHRIVAKVDELMALCDQLEQQQTDNIATHQTLVDTLLATLTSAADQGEFAEAWQRIAKHFDTLFITEHSIDQLTQTLLQLAAMGKLVPQDPNDEPASALLERIGKEKARLVEEGKRKKQKPLPEISEDDKLFELPQGWEWVRLGGLSILKGGFAYKSSVFSDSGNHQVIRMGNIRPDYLRLDERPVYIPTDLAEETSEYQIELNNILLTMTGTKGKRDYLYSLIVRPEHSEARKLYLNQRLCMIRSLLVVPEFLNMIIKDDRLLDAIYAQSTGTANQANIGMVAINNWVLPLPPIEEQQRIVNNVDELIALCETLKERLYDAQTTQVQLADAIVEQAVV